MITLSNEELAVLVADGDKNAELELYKQNKGLLYKHAYSFYILNRDRCENAGATIDDMMNESFFAVLSAARYYAKSDRQYKFTTYLRYTVRNCYSELAGLRTHKQQHEPLNSCRSLDEPLNEEEKKLTLADALEDKSESLRAEQLIDSLALADVLPEVERLLKDNPEQYEVIKAVYFDNVSQSELSRIKGVSKESIHQRKVRALRALQKHPGKLKDIYEDVIGMSYNMGKLSTFKRTRTSSVEWAVLKADEQLKRMLAELETEIEAYNKGGCFSPMGEDITL